MERKNLALEALKKLLNGEIKSKPKHNVIESRAFSRRFEEAVACNHANALSTVEMIQTLIDLAKDVKASAAWGEAEGLSDEELVLYGALTQSKIPMEAIGNKRLSGLVVEIGPRQCQQGALAFAFLKGIELRVQSFSLQVLEYVLSADCLAIIATVRSCFYDKTKSTRLFWHNFLLILGLMAQFFDLVRCIRLPASGFLI